MFLKCFWIKKKIAGHSEGDL